MSRSGRINELDALVSYTTHFELHCAASFEALKALSNTDNNEATTRYDSGETLLINTRKDAHNSIDNVRINYGASYGTEAKLMATGKLTLTIEEPGGMYFAEKLKKHCRKVKRGDTDDFLGVAFALKIIFVGRTASNEIKTIVLPYVLPLMMTTASASFNHMGGTYDLAFDLMSFVLSADKKIGHNNQIVRVTTIINRNLSIKALTVQEALKKLEEKLNEFYIEYYSTMVDSESQKYAKKIKYTIKADPRISGTLNLLPSDTTAKDEEGVISFLPNTDVGDMIRRILFSCDDVLDMIGRSREGLKKQFHPDVTIPMIVPNYLLKGDELEIRYEIAIYTGGEAAANKYEFDFYFADPGKNVDVINFDVKFPMLYNWFGSNTVARLDRVTNSAGTLQQDDVMCYAKDSIHVDKLKAGLEAPLEEKQKIVLGKNDIAHNGYTGEQSSAPGYRYKSQAKTRLAFDTLSEIYGAVGADMINLQIRGNSGLLSECYSYPDGSMQSFGITKGLWIKVNIFDQDKQPIYYTGYYMLYHVESIFQGGKFIQNLTMGMTQETTGESGKIPGYTKSTAKPAAAGPDPDPRPRVTGPQPFGSTYRRLVDPDAKRVTGPQPLGSTYRRLSE